MKKEITKMNRRLVVGLMVTFSLIGSGKAFANTITSTVTGGNWSDTGTWSGGILPGTGDDVTIADGATVTINQDVTINSLTVGQGNSGILQFETTTARTVTIAGNVSIVVNATFRTASSGTVTTHTLSIGGDLTNNGTLDFSTNSNTAGAGITFTGSSNNTFGGSGTTTDVYSITINKGTSYTPILELNTTNFSVRGSVTPVAATSWLILTNGTFKISGTFTMSSTLWGTNAYTIAAVTGIWLNNHNFTISGTANSLVLLGYLRVTDGIMNIGTGSTQALKIGSGSTTAVITIEGGTLNVAGRFAVNGANNIVTYTQTGGTITTCTLGNSTNSYGSFDLGTGPTSSCAISGGTIIIQIMSTASPAIDFRIACGGTINITGGTLQLGNASTSASQIFKINGGTTPPIILNNSSSNNPGILLAANTTVKGDITLNGTGNFDKSTFGLTIGTASGTPTITRAGTGGFVGTGAITFPSSINVTYSGSASGVTTGSELPVSSTILNNLTINNSNGVTLGANLTVNGTLALTSGTFADGGYTLTNKGNITGTGTHSGAGKISMTGSGKTISGATLSNLELNNAGGFSLNGSPTINGTLTLTSGNLTVGANTLSLYGPAIAGTATNLVADGTSSISIGGSSSGVNIPANISTLNNLTLNNSNGTTLQSGLAVGGTLTLTSGALAAGANTLTLKGSISGSGTINTSTTGTLAFGGTSEQTLAAANLTSGAVNVLTVNANAKLTTTGSITATTLNILNDGTSAGTGTLKDVSGTLTASSTNVTQFISGGRNWYLSSPVTGATGTGVIATSTATTKPIYFDWYDESKGSAGWTTQASTLTPALGYVAINSTSTPSTDGTLTFSGALNTGSIPVNLTTSSTTNYFGYNLVGNPFPAYLDISNLAGNSNLVASYWYRTYKSGGYVFDSENLPSGLGTSLSGLQMTGKIPPLQAFWLLANNAYSFSFSSANCVHQDNTNNKFRAPSTANAAQQVLRLQVSNGINSDEAIIYSNAAASNTYDAYDTPKMSNNNAAIPEIATIIDDQTLVINGFNTIPVNTELPLLFSTAQQNSFSIKASQFNNFDAGTQLILKDYADPVNPILTDISAGNSYTFSSGITTNNSSRFALIFKAPSIATAINEGSNDKVWISINVNKQIMINGKTGTASVTVYNALGQKLYSNNLTSNLSVVNTSLCSGVYVVTLTTEGKSISKKVIID